LNASAILASILRLSWPGVVLVAFQSAASIADTHFVGRLGTTHLAGLALVFPLVMLMQMMSAGAMGGGVSSAIARALGAKDTARASDLVAHAMVLGLAVGLCFALVLVGLGPVIYRLLGGGGGAFEHALTYSAVLFAGSPIVWLANFCAASLRGSGNTLVPACVLSGVAVIHIALTALLTQGYGPLPALGMRGPAVAYLVAFALGLAVFVVALTRPGAPLRLRFAGTRWRRANFVEMLHVGAISSLSAIQTVITTVILTGFVARFGVEAIAGYGVGVRLELLQVPLAFAVGAALVPLVGRNIGAGNAAEAKRIAWIGGAVAACISAAIGLTFALLPGAWIGLFSSDPAVIESGARYLRTVGPAYVFMGLGVALYFASQGARRVGWPVLSGTARLAVVMTGGWLVMAAGGSLDALYVVIALGLVTWGTLTVIAVRKVRWG